MIVTDDETLARNAASGIAGRVTLDAILRKCALTHPDRIALVDDPDRAGWNDLPPETLTWGALEERVAALAGFFDLVGLKTDSVVAIHAPATTDTVATFFAALRAGLIVALVPRGWGKAECREGLPRLQPKLLVSHGHVDGEPLAEMVRDVGAALFGVRFVFGFGRTLPDGVLNIDEMMRAKGGPLAQPVERRGNVADHVATVTFGAADRGQRPLHLRSHNQWIATGLMTLLEARMEDGAAIFSPYALSGMAGTGAALVPWLLSAGTLHLHHFRDLARLQAHIAETGPDFALVPALVAPGVAAIDPPPRAILALHRDGTTARPVVFPDGCRFYDLTALGDLTLIARPRESGAAPATLPIGPVRAPSRGLHGPMLVETWIDADSGPSGVLSVTGPAVADPGGERLFIGARTEVAADGFVSTGVTAALDGKGFRLAGDERPGVESAPPAARQLGESRADRSSEIARPTARAVRPGPGKARRPRPQTA